MVRLLDALAEPDEAEAQGEQNAGDAEVDDVHGDRTPAL
jgi:hypothetical protein